MKKYIIIALAAVVAFTACTKTNPEEKKAEQISFQVANYVPQTKAGEVSFLSEFENPADAHFQSKAYLHADGVQGARDYFGANGETIKWFSDKTQWRSEQVYFWPKSADSYINFVSWYDNKENTTTVTETTITWACNDIDADQNFMWADEAWGYKNNDGAVYKKDGVTEGVPTLFHHALAKLTINAKATTVAEEGTTWDITIENVSVNNHVNSAELVLTNTLTEAGATADTAPYTAAWDAKNVAGFSITSPAGKLTTDASDYVLVSEKSIFPLLQATETLNFDIHIKAYHGTTLYSEEVITKSILFNTLGTPAITAWNNNTKYTYTIIINPMTDIILFDPALEPWVATAEESATYTWPEE